MIYFDLFRNELGIVLLNYFSKFLLFYILNFGFNRISFFEEEVFFECINLKFFFLNYNNFIFVLKEVMKLLKVFKKLDFSGNLVMFIFLDVFVILCFLEFFNVSFCEV